MADLRDGVTDLLARAGAGDRAALDAVLPLVYGELRRLAARQMRRADAGHTLSPTGLVHEAFLRLVRDDRGGWESRAHFFALAAGAMRHVLVDHARRHAAAKRGGAAVRVPLDDVDGLPVDGRAELLLALDESLARLAAFDPRQARVVECRFFGGYSEEETAAALGVGLRTVKRDWAKARAWLFDDLHAGAAP